MSTLATIQTINPHTVVAGHRGLELLAANANRTKIHGIIPLFKSGCEVHHGSYDCTTACTKDPAGMWQDLNALQNCLVYPTISNLLNAKLLDTSSVNVATDYGILPASEIDLTSSISYPINDCAMEF
jgi:hypothetical protein